MENTGKVLFENDEAVWFLSIGDETVGPLQAADLYEKILLNQITSAHYVWKKGLKAWQRIAETPPFTEMLPKAPKAVPTASMPAGEKTQGTQVKASSSKSAASSASRETQGSDRKFAIPEHRVWFLYFNDSQFGPFSLEEVKGYLRVGKINPRVHAWKEGMKEWTRIETLIDFRDAVEVSKKIIASGAASTAKEDKRENPRLPLVAKVLVANDSQVMSAICRDISIGGMQVLTDQIPGAAGSRIRLNVTPPNDGQGKPVSPFVAEGVIVRVLEDGRGFSFRFDQLTPEARKAIESYVQQV